MVEDKICSNPKKLLYLVVCALFKVKNAIQQFIFTQKILTEMFCD